VFITSLLIFVILTPLVIFLGAKVCLSDPTDPVIYNERILIQKTIKEMNNGDNQICGGNISKHTLIDTRDYESLHMYVCDICMTHVQDRTKHCRECNR
jgi:hypothetical protein